MKLANPIGLVSLAATASHAHPGHAPHDHALLTNFWDALLHGLALPDAAFILAAFGLLLAILLKGQGRRRK